MCEVGAKASMSVFDPSTVADLHRRYASKSRSYQPDLYYVATSDERAMFRAWLDASLLIVPEPGRSRLLQRLRTDSTFATAVNELAVATVLAEAGLRPRYEVNVGGLTPDLVAPGSGGARTIIVEVVTRELANGESSRRRGWEGLRERIESIPVPVGLLLEPKTRQLRHPDPMVAKQVVRELRAWLLDADRPIGSKFECLGYRFRVAGTMPDRLTAVLARPGEGGAVDTEYVLKAIKDKTRRYRSIVVAEGVAFVVVLAAVPGAPLDVNIVRAALAGQQSFAIAVPSAPSGPLGEFTFQLRDTHSAPDLDPALSAIGCLSGEPDRPRLTIFDNPSATVSLPDFAPALVERHRAGAG